MSALERRSFLAYCSSIGLGSTLFPGALWTLAQDGQPITPEMIERAEHIAGIQLSSENRLLMVEDLNERLADFAAIRELELPNAVPPALTFDPTLGGRLGAPPVPSEPEPITLPDVERPTSNEDLAFLELRDLASLIRSRRVSCTELLEVCLDRIRRYDPILEAVITLTEDRARSQALECDRELAAGVWRGPLHGIPWGAKDLLAVEGYPTTWGAVPYREQLLPTTAHVVRRLDEAGAVLVAKLSLGALAWGDVWFGGRTRNPWNLDQGSSGSSAGPGAAVAAGLVPFAIGSETLGSIVSPSVRNGVTGLRPTFGSVPRTGAMALSWSMDKLGPMCRSADACALVQRVIQSHDPMDPSSVDVPMEPLTDDVASLRVGYLATELESGEEPRSSDLAALDVLRTAGVALRPLELPDFPEDALRFILDAEAAAAFDGLTRSGGLDAMVRQERFAWPNALRAARFVPAVEYLQANRARVLLMEAMARMMSGIDVLVAPTHGRLLTITNLTGHPCVVVPTGFDPLPDTPDSPRRRASAVAFVGGLYREGAILSLARLFQHRTPHHRLRPPLE